MDAKTPSVRGDGGGLWQAASARFATGSLPILAALGSLIACYGTISAQSLFDVSTLIINPHLQAVLMLALALAAVFGLWRDLRRHRVPWPLLIGGAGTLVLVLTLYVRYDTRFEILAYVLLMGGAMTNQRAILVALNRRVRAQAEDIAGLNQRLESRVVAQGEEIKRLERLKEFLPASVAELVVAEGDGSLLDSHRRYIACLFCDIRDFTALSARLAPEDTMALLQAYHDQVGTLVAGHNGTIGNRSGDGYMVFFNDPIPCEAPVLDAVDLALAIRSAWYGQEELWRQLDQRVSIGIGIASGYATLGLIGSRGRTDYTAIGPEVNLAARLCDQASPDQILISRRAYLEVETLVAVRPAELPPLKGVEGLVEAYEVDGRAESTG